MNSIWRETWLAPLQHEGHYTNMSKHRRAVRRLNEILFSLNVGFAIALLLRNYLSHFGPGQNAFDDFSVRMIIWLNGMFNFSPQKYNAVGVELTVGSWVVSLALVVLLLLHLGEQLTKVRVIILDYVAGIVARAAIPATLVFILWPAYVRLEIAYWSVPFIPDKFAAAFEVGATVVCFSSYSRLESGIYQSGVPLSLLVLHYAIWFWVVWQLYHPIPETIFASALPLVRMLGVDPLHPQRTGGTHVGSDVNPLGQRLWKRIDSRSGVG